MLTLWATNATPQMVAVKSNNNDWRKTNLFIILLVCGANATVLTGAEDFVSLLSITE